MEIGRLVNNHFCATYIHCQSTRRLSNSPPISCDYFGLANYLKFCIVDIHERWLFFSRTPIVHPAFINVNVLWEARVPDCSNKVLSKSYSNDRKIASHLGPAKDVEGLRVLMGECVVATLKQLH